MIVTKRSSSSELSSPALDSDVECLVGGRYDYFVPLVEVNISLLADDVRISTTDTLDLRQRVHDFTFTLDVCVEQT